MAKKKNRKLDLVNPKFRKQKSLPKEPERLNNEYDRITGRVRKQNQLKLDGYRTWQDFVNAGKKTRF